jgi:hypothetical protein
MEAYNLVDPSAAIMNGLKMGATLNQVEDQRKQQLAQQQSTMAQMAALRGLASNPNASHADYAGVMTMFPGLAENLGKAWKVLDEGQKTTAVDFGTRAYSALLANQPQVAVDMIRERAVADKPRAQHWNTIADLIEKAPAQGRTLVALNLAGLMGPDKFKEAFTGLQADARSEQLQPDAARKATADADKAAQDALAAGSDAVIKGEQAKVAPQTVALDLQKKGWDIKKIQEDIEIAKQANRISAMNAATAREGNDLKKRELQLKVQEAEQKLGDSMRAKVADVETARTSMDNLLNTADRFLKTAIDPKTGKPSSTLRAASGPLDSKLPTLQTDVADLEALLEGLGSQAFMAQVPNMKGLGALSNAEGDKLQASLQNLKLSQSPEQLVANIKEAQRLIIKGRKTLATRYGVPDTVPDTPAAADAAGPNEIDKLVQQYTAQPAKPGRKN